MSGETAQTLDRGIRVLDLLADAPDGLSVSEISRRLNVARGIVYRLVATLVQHGLVKRDTHAQYRLGLAVLALSRRVIPVVQAAAGPVARELAEATSATAFVAVPDGGEITIIRVAEPPTPGVHASCSVGKPVPIDASALARALPPFRQGSAASAAPRAAVAVPVSPRSPVVAVVSAVLGVGGIDAVVGALAIAPAEVEPIRPQVAKAAARLGAAIG